MEGRGRRGLMARARRATRPMSLSLGVILDMLFWGGAGALLLLAVAVAADSAASRVGAGEMAPLVLALALVAALLFVDVMCWKMRKWALFARLGLLLASIALALGTRTFYLHLMPGVAVGNFLMLVGSITALREMARMDAARSGRSKRDAATVPVQAEEPEPEDAGGE